MKKAVIIGVGNVGATTAYALSLSSLVQEIILIDIDKVKAQGHCDDINHVAMYLDNVQVSVGNYSDVEDADFVIITAGVNQEPGEDRISLLNRNVSITKSILDNIKPYLESQIIIFVSNPVDVLTHYALKYLNYSPSKLFGTGTSLDTARFKYLIGKNINLNPVDVNGYVLGEHGEHSVPVYDCDNLGILGLSNFCLPKASLDAIHQDTRDAAATVIKAKGATYYAIGVVVTQLVRSIIKNDKKIVPLSTTYKDICISLPCVLGEEGIEKVLNPNLDETASRKFNDAYMFLKDIIVQSQI
jgi:L-lactate dehydrogenase